MSQLTRTTWDNTYNQFGSGSFKNNTSQLITEAVMRQFSKDAEDSLAFLSNANVFNVSNDTAISISGNTTSNSKADLYISRSGASSLSYGMGGSIQLKNTTSSKSILLQNSDDYFQIFTNTTETLRIRSDGCLIIGTQGSSEDNSGDNGIVSYFTSAFTDIIHLNADFFSNQTVATTHGIQSLEGYCLTSHTSGIVNQCIATIGNFELGGAGNVTEARSVDAGGVITGSGTLTNWYLYWCGTGPISGAVTNGYGLYVDVFKTGFTNKFGVYVADTTCKNVLHGKLNLADLPTSSAGLTSGDIWVNSNVLTRVP